MDNQELKNLQAELGLSDQEIQQIENDLTQGDNLLNTLPVEPLSDQLAKDITRQVNLHLQRPHRMVWPRRVAAVIVVAFTALSVLYLRDDQPTPMPTVTITTQTEQQIPEADRQLWEFALTLDDHSAFENSQDIDTQTMTDLLILFDEAQVSTDNPIGQDRQETRISGVV